MAGIQPAAPDAREQSCSEHQILARCSQKPWLRRRRRLCEGGGGRPAGQSAVGRMCESVCVQPDKDMTDVSVIRGK